MKLNKLIALIAAVLMIVPVACSQSQNKAKADKSSETDLFAQASKAEAAGQYQRAVDIYESIAANFPDSPLRDKALFMTGFLKSENLNQKQEALTYFNELIQKYPESDLIDDAQFMIQAIESGQDALTKFEENTSDQ